MIKKLLFGICCLCLLAACGETDQPTEAAEAMSEQMEMVEQPDHFGEVIEADGAVAFNELLDDLEEIDSMPAKVVGTVESVCQKKGCWMNIVSDDDGKEMMVKFKDYGFFVPKDIAGRKVVMDGYAYREVTPVDELRHYAEDAGQSKEEIEAITEPKEELKFLASGVILLDEEN